MRLLSWFRNRFVHRSHTIRTGLQPGAYHEVDERMLHGMFTELIDFIEVEKAWMHCCVCGEDREKFSPPRYRFFREWRCPQAGLAHLDWEAELKYDEDMGVSPGDALYGQFTSQAIGAQTQRRLYHWWKTERSIRVDEGDYEEDTARLIELVEIRGSLWT